MNKENLRNRYREEMRLARAAEAANDLGSAFAHLERAHVLGQRWFWRHLRTHWSMLMIAWRRNDAKEISGQIKRLIAVPLGWISGWVPKGNTGGASVGALQSMPLPEDMHDDLAGFSVRDDVLIRIVVVGAGGIALFLGSAFEM